MDISFENVLKVNLKIEIKLVCGSLRSKENICKRRVNLPNVRFWETRIIKVFQKLLKLFQKLNCWPAFYTLKNKTKRLPLLQTALVLLPLSLELIDWHSKMLCTSLLLDLKHCPAIFHFQKVLKILRLFLTSLLKYTKYKQNQKKLV